MELLTFVFLAVAGGVGLLLARRCRERGLPATVWLFHLLFAAALLVVAMEEIAWGQKFLSFSTPAALEEINRQSELTLHNIGPLQGRSELFRLAFGFGGLLGILLSHRSRWARIAVPAVLWPWFATIAIASVLDLHADYAAVSAAYERGWRWTSEVVELLIGVAALLYVALKGRELALVGTPLEQPAVEGGAGALPASPRRDLDPA